MSRYTDEAAKPRSNKIILVEIDLPLANDRWINYEAGIWFYTLTPGPVTITGSDGETGYYAGRNEVFYNVQSLSVDVTQYQEVESIADLRLQNESFHYEPGSTKIYVHFNNFDPPDVFELIELGTVLGFCDKIDPENNGYYRDIYYSPKVRSIPALKKAKDPLFFGLMQYSGGIIAFDNADGTFDDFAQRDLYGQPVRVYFTFEGLAYEDAHQVYRGFIEAFDHDFSEFRLNIQDLRKSLSRSLPTRRFDLTTYVNLKEDNDGAPIPLIWGTCRQCPAICVNEAESPAPAAYTFLIADTTDHPLFSIDTVYNLKTGASWTSGFSPDLNAGTFTLSSVDYSPGDDVAADVRGFADTSVMIENALDVIRDVLLTYGSISYSNSTFYVTEWNTEHLTTPVIGLCLFEEKKISEIIEEICVSADGIFEVRDDGRFTFRSYHDDRIPSAVIEDDEWIDEPVITYPSEEYLSSVVVKYSRNWHAGTYRQYENTDYETEVYNIYKRYAQKPFETLLTTKTDAVSRSESIMLRSKEIVPTVAATVKTQHIGLAVMDFIVASVNRYERSLFAPSVWEVVGIDKSITAAEIPLTLRYVKPYEEEAESVEQDESYADGWYADMWYVEEYA